MIITQIQNEHMSKILPNSTVNVENSNMLQQIQRRILRTIHKKRE